MIYNFSELFCGKTFWKITKNISKPVVINIYVAANLVKSTLDKVAKEVWIYVIAVIAGLIFLTFFPQISLYIPVTSGLYIP